MSSLVKIRLQICVPVTLEIGSRWDPDREDDEPSIESAQAYLDGGIGQPEDIYPHMADEDWDEIARLIKEARRGAS